MWKLFDPMDTLCLGISYECMACFFMFYKGFFVSNWTSFISHQGCHWSSGSKCGKKINNISINDPSQWMSCMYKFLTSEGKKSSQWIFYLNSNSELTKSKNPITYLLEFFEHYRSFIWYDWKYRVDISYRNRDT